MLDGRDEPVLERHEPGLLRVHRQPGAGGLLHHPRDVDTLWEARLREGQGKLPEANEQGASLVLARGERPFERV